jgi:hypothetical protein
VTNDPFLDRELGRRRVRVVTAWVAGAAVVGTGATALALASADRASAQQATTPVRQSTDEGTSGDDDGSVAPTAPQDGVQLPAAPPARSFGDRSGHASSGGS